LKITNFYKIQ